MATPRERVFSVLAGEKPDRMPFNIWSNRVPDEATLRALLEREACITVKSAAYGVDLEGVRVERESGVSATGVSRSRCTYHTSAGSLSVTQREMPETVWTETHPFSSARDYDALECFLAAHRYTPSPERILRDDAVHPDQCIARPATLHSPLHEVMNDLLGVGAFCLEWFDNRERVERLCALNHDNLLRQVQLLADGPAQYCIVDGNTQFDILGLERYERYCLPYINEACEILHCAGKLVGAHLDGNNAAAAHLVGRTNLDFIESFCPPPACDLALTAARQAWPGKGLLLNFPSALHLHGAKEVRNAVRNLLEEAGDGRGVAMGVIENVPTNEHLLLLAEETLRWQPR